MLLKNLTNGRTIVDEVKALQGNGIRGTKDRQKILDCALWLYYHMGFLLTTAPLTALSMPHLPAIHRSPYPF